MADPEQRRALGRLISLIEATGMAARAAMKLADERPASRGNRVR